MKKRISATVDDKTLEIIDSLLKQGDYRNKSHVIEKAIQILAGEKIYKRMKNENK